MKSDPQFLPRPSVLVDADVALNPYEGTGTPSYFRNGEWVPMGSLDEAAPFWERPCAAHGLKSYRYKGGHGWIMIGATDDADAIREANRSLSKKDATIDKLERWTGEKYAPATP